MGQNSTKPSEGSSDLPGGSSDDKLHKRHVRASASYTSSIDMSTLYDTVFIENHNFIFRDGYCIFDNQRTWRVFTFNNQEALSYNSIGPNRITRAAIDSNDNCVVAVLNTEAATHILIYNKSIGQLAKINNIDISTRIIYSRTTLPAMNYTKSCQVRLFDNYFYVRQNTSECDCQIIKYSYKAEVMEINAMSAIWNIMNVQNLSSVNETSEETLVLFRIIRSRYHIDAYELWYRNYEWDDSVRNYIVKSIDTSIRNCARACEFVAHHVCTSIGSIPTMFPEDQQIGCDSDEIIVVSNHKQSHGFVLYSPINIVYQSDNIIYTVEMINVTQKYQPFIIRKFQI